MNIYVIVDPRTMEPVSRWHRHLYAYTTQGKATGVAKQIGLKHWVVVPYVAVGVS